VGLGKLGGLFRVYKDSDLDAAVAGGIMQPDVAERFRRLSAERVGNPGADDEHFTVVSGLSEVYVTFGIVLILSATYMATSAMGPFAGLLCAVLGWLLAEYFTRRRRMVLPSIVLLLAFVLGNVFGWFAMSLILPGPGQGQPYLGPISLADSLTPLRGLFVTASTFLACLCYWLRFGFPLAYAATVLAAYNLPIYLLRVCLPSRSAALEDATILGCGLVTFAVAMWWDMSDVYRQTRRSDIAFWLHALAGTVLAMMGLQLVVGISPSAGVPFDQFSRVFCTSRPRWRSRSWCSTRLSASSRSSSTAAPSCWPACLSSPWR
jgi:hypothetical protein